MKILNRIQPKLILAFLVVVLLPLISTSLYGNWVTSRALEQVALDATRHQLEQLAADMSLALTGLSNEALYLSQLESLNNFLDARVQAGPQTEETTRQRLALDFLTYAQTHLDTYQLRYINEEGQEIVRIDCQNQSCSPRPEQQLQNKADRYYFTETMRLSPGQIYVSPLDLNREFQQIEQPYRPVIRLAVPLFFPNTANRAGIMVINILAEPILNVVDTANTAGQNFILAGADGYYLTHPDSSQRWGGPENLNTGAGLARDYGSLPADFRETHQGISYYPPQPGWQQLAAQLLPPGPLLGNQQAIMFQQVAPFGENGPVWILFSDQPRAALSAPVDNFRWTAIAILLLAALAALAMAIILARHLTAPILTLTKGAHRIEQGEWHHRITISAQDEIGDLAVAFNAMAASQQHHLEQLSALYHAGQHITAPLEQTQVLEVSLFAAEKMFPATYSRISLNKGTLNQTLAQAERGDKRWAAYRQAEEHQIALRATLDDFEWRTGRLVSGPNEDSFFCCAPLCGGKTFVGLLEIYGSDAELATPSTGNMLAALAAQISISLENAWLYGRLQEHRAQLQDLVERLISAQEEERRMLAYDLHDGLVQRLVGTRLQLTNYADEQSVPDDQTLAKGLTQLGESIAEARAIIEGLRPVLLDDFGLVEALRQHTQIVGFVAGWQVSFEALSETLEIPDFVEITAFRIVQEALTNAQKYAQSQRVAVTVQLQDNNNLSITVRDWGRGFDMAAVQNRQRQVGLTSMRERARLVGGECIINSALGAGATIQVLLPVAASPIRSSLEEFVEDVL